MVDVKLPGAGLLKQSVSCLLNVVDPMERATINFCRDGMSMLTSPLDGSCIAVLRIKRESFSLFLIADDFSVSCSINLDLLRLTLNAAGDDDVVGILGPLNNNRVKFTFKKPAVEATRSEHHPLFRNFVPAVSSAADDGIMRMMEVHEADEDLLDFHRKPREYVVKIVIATPIFKTTLQFFKSFKIDTVYVFITDREVTFFAGLEKKILSRERNEYTIEGVAEQGDGPYMASLSLNRMKALDGSIGSTNKVWIYPTHPGGQLVALSCSVDPIGDLTYFFI